MRRCSECAWCGGDFCRITRHVVNPAAEVCSLAKIDLSKHDICATCGSYGGMGDWGLDCASSYNRLCGHALTKACSDYIRGPNAWGMTDEMLAHGALGIGEETHGREI